MFPSRSEEGMYLDENINLIAISPAVIFSRFYISENFALFSAINITSEINVGDLL